MVLIVNPLGGNFYMDGRLSRELSVQHEAVNVRDKDRFFVCDGAEGSGKSVLIMQVAAKLDPSFCLDRVCFTPVRFKSVVKSARKGQAVVFDEAFTGLSSRASLSRINQLLVSLMMEMRQKNLFVFIVLPTIFLLDKYVALWRSVGLFHVYTVSGRRGQWCYFNRKKKKLLYLRGKKDYAYSGKGIPRSGFRGRFLNQYVVDEKNYRRRKRLALESKELSDYVGSEYLFQRDAVIWALKDKLGVTYRELELLLKDFGVELSYNTLSLAVGRANKRLKSGLY